MHGRGRQRGVVGFEAAGVDDPRGTGFRDGSDLLGVLAVAVGQVGARDQHEHIHRRNGGGVIVVDDRGVHPSGGVVNDLGQSRAPAITSAGSVLRSRTASTAARPR